MIVTAYASCGRLVAGPTADVTDVAARCMAATIRRHLSTCGCRVRVTVSHRGALIREATLTPQWLADHAGHR